MGRDTREASMSSPSTTNACANCGAEALGAYCAACGQRTDVDPRSLRQWFHDLLGETFSIDGRSFNTLKALLSRPGYLTQEWRRGRQARWLRPFRLYLMASLFYFGIGALIPADPDMVTVEHAGEVDIGSEAELAAEMEGAFASAPRAMFLAVPLFALMLKVLFRGSGWFYTEHLINALHLHAFAFLVLGAAWTLEPLPGPWDYWLQTPFLFWMLGYPLTALYRTYGGRVATVVLRAVPLFIGYPVILLVLVLVGGSLVGGVDSELRRSDDQYWRVRELEDVAGEDRGRQLTLAETALVSYRRTETRLVDAQVRVHMGDLLMVLNQPERARLEAEIALFEEPSNLLAIGLLGLASEALADTSATQAAARRFLDVYPGGGASIDERHRSDLDRYLAWAKGIAPELPFPEK